MSTLGSYRFQTKEQDGKAQIFWQQQSTKKSKKTTYKTKVQKYPLRSKQTKEDPPDPTTEDDKPVRKNIAKHPPRVKRVESKKSDDTTLTPGTVTLTQEQLSAILTSIGKVNKDNPLHISIDKETNHITVKEELEENKENNEETDDTKNDEVEQEENIINLLNGLENEKEPTSMTGYDSLKPASRNESGPSMSPLQPERDLPPKVLTVSEKKHLQWQRERDELTKINKKYYDPWGRPGAGAPIRDNKGGVLADFNTRKEGASMNQMHQSPPSNYQKILGMVSPAVEVKSPAVLNTATEVIRQNNPSVYDSPTQPSAIRSSFIVGEVAPKEDRFASVIDEDKRKWLQDLEKQREENRFKKQLEKEAERAKIEKETWADKLSMYEPMKPPKQTEHHSSPQLLRSSRLEPQIARISSAPQTSIDDTVMESMTFIRGQNINLDAATFRELQDRRRKHLEHQQAIQDQVEEKQRLKREERDRRIRDELQEEGRLQAERDTLQDQYRAEQDKLRKKEEEQNRRVQVLKEAMEEAQEKATHEKHLKRLAHLQSHGHDVSHLHRSYEAKHTPRGEITEVTHVEPTHVPGLSLEVATDVGSYILSPSSVYKTVDLSPRKEFGTQTGTTDEDIAKQLSSASYPDMSQAREDSAHIQFKGKLLLKTDSNLATNKKVRVKSAQNVKSKKQQIQQMQPISENPPAKMLWNYQNRQRARPVKNSEKDPNYMRHKKMIEDRRLQREQELLALAAANKSKIPLQHERRTKMSPLKDSSPKKTRDVQFQRLGKSEKLASPEGAGNRRATNQKASTSSRENKSTYHHRVDRSPPPPSSVPYHETQKHSPTSQRPSSPPVPAVKHRLQESKPSNDKYGLDENLYYEGEFMPFLRSSAFLDPSESQKPLPVSREATCVERGRKAYAQGLKPGDYGSRMTNIFDHNPEKPPSSDIKDPILNPSLVKDHPTGRQELILQQLQDIRKNLLERKKEIETCLSPSDLVRNDDITD